MNILDRLATLARADAHGVVDAVEDKQLLLKQHLREAETELHRKQARIEALEVEKNDLTEQQAKTQLTIRQLDKDIGLALADGAEDLARFSIKRLLPLRQLEQELVERVKQLDKEHSQLIETLELQREQFDALKTRTRDYIANTEQHNAERQERVYESVADEEIELELLRRKRDKPKTEKGVK